MISVTKYLWTWFPNRLKNKKGFFLLIVPTMLCLFSCLFLLSRIDYNSPFDFWARDELYEAIYNNIKIPKLRFKGNNWDLFIIDGVKGLFGFSLCTIIGICTWPLIIPAIKNTFIYLYEQGWFDIYIP